MSPVCVSEGALKSLNVNVQPFWITECLSQGNLVLSKLSGT